METIRFLTLEGPLAQLPEPLRRLAEEITADLGHIPNDYIAAAQGLAGQAAPSLLAASSPAGQSLVAPLTYDEWDFRRNGFRKDWCILFEKQLQPIKGTFVDSTLDKYHGLLRQLKNQFEMLRTRERFIKRQRDGNDIDLDALIESISDARAGKPPSERLFIRLQRDERDIAVLFLVDMSSSTEGWINQALKEALILMGEALQVLGDRFAIYGFSGMRRLRSDFYRVKNFADPYNEETKGRIAAIGPQEYTRMGPALRHAVGLLQKEEAKVRLLVTLSDGKPEDYDDYKGEYAIEDTRHALIEAKAAGIHPFCITIDKQAHDYIGRMYGEVNYIFVDEVRKLPVRLPEIYRVLTT
jgi:nitric oxide reductase NorD protein